MRACRPTSDRILHASRTRARFPAQSRRHQPPRPIRHTTHRPVHRSKFLRQAAWPNGSCRSRQRRLASPAGAAESPVATVATPPPARQSSTAGRADWSAVRPTNEEEESLRLPRWGAAARRARASRDPSSDALQGRAVPRLQGLHRPAPDEWHRTTRSDRHGQRTAGPRRG